MGGKIDKETAGKENAHVVKNVHSLLPQVIVLNTVSMALLITY